MVMEKHNPETVILQRMREIVPACRYDGTSAFTEWQTNARQTLWTLLGLDNMQSCDPQMTIVSQTEKESYTQIRFSFQSEPGYEVPGYVLLPRTGRTPFPVMICLQGHSTGMHISLGEEKFDGDAALLSGERNFAQIAVEYGYCAVVIEQRYMGECGGDAIGPGCCANGRGGTASAVKSLLVGRCAIGERVWDVSRTIDVVCPYFPQMNLQDISCMGNSGGGTTAFYAACVDERIRYAMPSCAVCTYLDSIAAQYHCPCNYIPGIALYFDMEDLGGLVAPRGLVIVAGEEDPIFPIAGVRKTAEGIRRLYRAAGAEEAFQLAVGNGGHRFYADAAYTALQKIVGDTERTGV